jgi:hypothetical protein
VEEENIRVAVTSSLLMRAVMGEVEGSGPDSGAATC